MISESWESGLQKMPCVRRGGDEFTMESGQMAGSRFGIKGTEEITDGLTVGFVLENGFNSDTGALSDKDRFFGRESQVFVKTALGTLSMGRVGTLVSDAGSFGLTGSLSPFGTGWSDVGSQSLVFATTSSRRDNTVTYVSPTVAGVTVYAQYAMGDANENKSNAKNGRYAALGTTYSNGNLGAMVIVDYLNKDSSQTNHGKDMWTVTGGVNYTCPFATSYLGAQYFKDANEVGGSAADGYGFNLMNPVHDKAYADLTGYGVVAGLDVPAMGGVAKVSVGYMNAESDRAHKEVTRLMAGVGYEYAVSKRTTLYSAAGYVRDSVDNATPTMVQAIAGMKHTF